jgi:hypothetical protein
VATSEAFHSTSATALPPRGRVQASTPIASDPSTAPAAARQCTGRSPDPSISIVQARLIAPDTYHRTVRVTDGGADGYDTAHPLHARLNDVCEGFVPSSRRAVDPSPLQPARATPPSLPAALSLRLRPHGRHCHPASNRHVQTAALQRLRS